MTPFADRNLEEFVLGSTAETITVETSAENRAATLHMLQQTSHTVDIFSRELDALVYDNAETVQAIRQIAARSRRARIRILVQNPARALAQSHRLIEIGRRLSSFVEIRLTAPEHRSFNTALLVADRIGTIVRRFADRYDGEVDFCNPLPAREYSGTFDEMWSVSHADANLRSLHI